jgi:predicted ArsR family transcriptional regulator
MATTTKDRPHGDVRNINRLSPKQKQVYAMLTTDRATPAQIAKRLKISVNGVYGHMRRIEAHGVDLGQFRSSNGSSRKRSPRRRSSRNGNGFSPGVQRLVKKLDTEEKALKDEARDLDQEVTIAKAKVISAEDQRTSVEQALKGIAVVRTKLERTPRIATRKRK